MKSILNFIKKHTWFKIGKWKEPVFIQDIVVRAYLKNYQSIVLPYHPPILIVSGFSQYILKSEYEYLITKLSNNFKKNYQTISKQIKHEHKQAIKNLQSFKPERLESEVIKKYVELIMIHSRQSVRFIFLGYVLEKLYPQTLPKKFFLGGKKYTPQSLLALTALPKKLMPMIAERVDLLKIAVKIKQHRSAEKELKNHALNFGWMNSVCWWDEPFNQEYYLVEAIKLSKNNPRKELIKIIQARERQHDRASEILKEIKFKFPLAYDYIDIIRDLALMREESWDVVSLAGVYARPLFKNLAAKYHLSYNQLLMLNIKEMTDLVAGKIKVSADELNNRLKHFTIFSNSNDYQILSGETAERLSAALDRKQPRVSVLCGLPIWPGKARGRVRVLRSINKIENMRAGEILVCPMTDPDYMPAIRKAKALVADQGGLLCHAAIVARELQKVCLVGTQIATKVLRDGDLVEVDADRGVVKILKRK